MPRAAHFFIEEHLASAPIHTRIVPEGEFAEVARSRVDLSHVLQIFLPCARTGLDCFAVAEDQAHSLDGTAIEGGRNVERNNAIRALLYRTGEEFAAGKIALPVAVNEDAILNGECQVRPIALDTYLFVSGQPINQPLLLRR